MDEHGDADIIQASKDLVAHARQFVGGIDDNLFRSSYAMLSALSGTGFPGIKGMLVHGQGGVGKSAMVDALLFAGNITCIKSHASALYSPIEGETEDALSKLFCDALERAPCVLVIDNIENIASRPKKRGDLQERKALTRLLSCLDALPVTGRVFVVGISGRREALDPSLYRGGRLDLNIAMLLPCRDVRLEMLKIMCRQMHLYKEICHADTSMASIADRTHGYEPSELAVLLRVVLEHVFKRKNGEGAGNILMDDYVEAAASRIRPSVLRDRPPLPNAAGWDELQGMAVPKQQVREGLLAALGESGWWDSIGLAAPKGIFLHGPSGCGKTALAVGAAKEFGRHANFICAEGTELIGSAMGSSEKAIANIFRQARACAPCILFLDQFDAFAPHRGKDSSSERTFDRVLSQLLIELDSVRSQGERIVLIAASSRPEVIDKAILRPGRLDLHISLPLPDRDTRIAIFQAYLDKCLQATVQDTELSQAQDVEFLLDAAEMTDGLSGADLVNICREAGMMALRDWHAHAPPWCGHAPEVSPFCVQVTPDHMRRVLQALNYTKA